MQSSVGLIRFIRFIKAQYMPQLSVCLSVCLSQVGVLLKLLNVGSRKQRHSIAHQDSSFLMPKISAKFKRDHPNGGAKCRRGRLKLSTFDK